MAAPASPTGLLLTAGYGCAQAIWTAPTGQPITRYTVTCSSNGPSGSVPTGRDGYIWDGNERPGSAAWQYLGAPSAFGWTRDNEYESDQTITVAGNVWLALTEFTSGGSQPAGLSASGPAAGTTVDDGDGQWVIAFPWFGGWSVSSASTPPSICLSNGGVYLCKVTGTTFATVSINLNAPGPAGKYQPPVFLTIPRLDNNQSYAVAVAATNNDGTSSPSSSVTVTPADFDDGLTNVISFLEGEIAHDYLVLLGQNPPVMKIGPQFLGDIDDGHRIVFVPKGGPIVGGELLGSDDDPFSPGQIWDARERVECHVWGLKVPSINPADPMRDTIASYARSRKLADHMTATLHRIGIGSTLPLPRNFPRGRDKVTRGADLIATIEILVPITRYPPSVGEITGINSTYQIASS